MSDVQPQPKASRYLSFWAGGMDSLWSPSDIGEREYANAENLLNRGGIVQTRPGYRLKATIPGERLQGMGFFQPKNAMPRQVVAVDGKVYVAKPPFTNFELLEGVAFSPTADHVVFKTALKSVRRNSDGTLTLIDPYSVLIIQDGKGAAAYWDGSVARHLKPELPFLETRQGLWMAWIGSRLWVADGPRLYASDLADPLSFSENTYLAERSNFDLGEPITGMIETSDQRALLVFTADSTYAFKAGIHDRLLWRQEPDFQTQLLPGIGCVAGKSPVNQYGATFWYSKQGLVDLDAAQFSLHSSKVLSLDGKMMRSKRNLSSRVDRICSAAFENFLLLSVPSGNLYNAHTWVLDQATLGDSQSLSWAGVWTGIRPVEWATVNLNGQEKLYCASLGERSRNGTKIHLWEAFRPERQDNYGAIPCQFETGAVTSEDLQKFHYAELDVTELYGTVQLTAYVGGSRGAWHKILDTKLQAEPGSIGSALQQVINHNSVIEGYKPQNRVVKTEQFSPQERLSTAETTHEPGIDKSFQILVQWRGRMGLRGVKVITSPFSETAAGAVYPSEEGQHNVVTDRGDGVTNPVKALNLSCADVTLNALDITLSDLTYVPAHF